MRLTETPPEAFEIQVGKRTVEEKGSVGGSAEAVEDGLESAREKLK